jgi:hypothetical protein
VSEQGDLLGRISRALHEAGIAHMVVGSLASSFHGEPRQTRDVDIVIEADPEGVRRFLALLDDDAFYADVGAAAEAVERRTSFNVIERATGWKVDLIVRRDRPFSVEELRRRLPVDLLGTRTQIATAEDTIIAKLEWAAEGASERQLGDVAAIIRTQGARLDWVYLERWIEKLELDDTWRRALDLAG